MKLSNKLLLGGAGLLVLLSFFIVLTIKIEIGPLLERMIMAV